MERQFIRSVKNKERLDKSLNNWETAMRGASTASAFFTTAPLTTALCKRDAQLGALVIGCAWFALAIFIGMMIGFGMRPNIAADRFYRFTALELRSGVHIMQPSISAFQILTEEIYDNAFQILTKNCHADDLRSSKLRPTTISVTPTTTNVYYDYLMDPKPILHGFLLQTNRNDPGGDPSRFSVEMSFDNVTWSVIGGSSWTFGEDKIIKFGTVSYDLTLDRGKVVMFDFESDQVMVIWMLRALLKGCAYTIIAIAGYLRQSRLCLWVLGLCYVCCAVIDWSALSLNDDELGLGHAHFVRSIHSAHGAVSLMVVVMVVAMQKHFVVLQIAFSAIFVGLQTYLHSVFWGDTVIMVLGILADAILVTFMLAVLFLRRRIIFLSNKLIQLDKESYDAVWRMIKREDRTERNQLETLSSIIKNSGYESIKRPPGQFNRFPEADDANTHNTHNLSADAPAILQVKRMRQMRVLVMGPNNDLQAHSSDIDYNSPVTSLDQLMNQSYGTDPLLKKKVQFWALHSNGYFPFIEKEWIPSLPRSETRSKFIRSMSAKGVVAFLARTSKPPGQSTMRKYVKWETICNDDNCEQKIKWAKIKTAERCMQKLMRAYRGDVSRLVDITRQSIIFEKVSDIVACLFNIMKDPEIVIERIKNRLDLDYDSRQSAGYRDLALNLRINSQDTKDLGLNTHVCEVQLILRHMAEMKSDDGHKRYVEFRDARAE